MEEKMNFHILTLFPDMVMRGMHTSIIGNAAETGILEIEAVDIRDYTKDRRRKVDDYPYGGGAGMLMQAQPVYDAWSAVAERILGAAAEGATGECTRENGEKRRVRTVYVTPQGVPFTQAMAKELAAEEDLVILCGHYEGIDERVLAEIVTDYISIGDYVLTGGELAAMVIVDAVSRMVPGVLSNESSGESESFEGHLLEYPQYSRPECWMGKRVPDVLLSGNRKKIREWRTAQAEQRTRERRPDLYRQYEKLQQCREILGRKKLLHIDMTELIVRGKARLVAADGANICLRDADSGIYFLTAESPEAGRKLLDGIPREPGVLLVLHQEFLCGPAMENLGTNKRMDCCQLVYTRREKLSVAGLYCEEQTAQDGAILIRKLGPEYADTVFAHYEMAGDPAYIRERIAKGCMFGAFSDGELAGFAGSHTEGSIGMLEVLPEYRGRKIGKALETYMINRFLEQGYTPYGQVKAGNEISMRLQESLGLYAAKEMVYWVGAI